MKKAVIVTGTHYVGKSRTINNYLKPKLGIGIREHKFTRNGQDGFILSQTCEEADRDIDDVIKRYSHYELLVLAARPRHETHSYFNQLSSKLSNAGYRVDEVVISSKDSMHYEQKATEIIGYLDN
jgi:hypothetical protein